MIFSRCIEEGYRLEFDKNERKGYCFCMVDAIEPSSLVAYLTKEDLPRFTKTIEELLEALKNEQNGSITGS